MYFERICNTELKFFMKITYLGTAAAEGWPAIFCNCEYCKKAKELGGKNIRTRSQALINEDLLIDFPADTYAHMLQNRHDLSAVKYCFVTHSHIDHFEPTDVIMRMESCFAHKMTEPVLHFYGNKAVLNRYNHFVRDTDEEEIPPSVTINEIKAYDVTVAGHYTVTALPAFHAPKETPFVYLLTDGEKTLLYLHDTGLPFDEVSDYLEKNNIKADLVSYDCTYGALPSAGGHMGLDSVPLVKARLESTGVCGADTIHVVNHFSHNGMLLHDELCEAASKLGFIVAYDGMSIEF
ncbi:MAG: hypothetical protein E7595_04075 [Ruminococcaceae bacterium]|nr:hypothetical protein [Oscillospiraceae bacterium]